MTTAYQCKDCKRTFFSPVYKERCFKCGGDQEPEWNLPVAALSLIAIAFLLIAWVMTMYACVNPQPTQPIKTVAPKMRPITEVLCL